MESVSQIESRISEYEPGEPLRGKLDVVTDPDVKCVRVSNFLLTISTNVRFTQRRALAVASFNFGNALIKLFRDYLDKAFRIFLPGDSFAQNVGSVKIKTTLEYSPYSGLHSHSVVEVVHSTRLHMDLNQINFLLMWMKPLGPDRAGKSFRVHCLFLPRGHNTSVENAKRYIMKNVRGIPHRICEGVEFPDEFVFSHELVVSDMQIKASTTCICSFYFLREVID